MSELSALVPVTTPRRVRRGVVVVDGKLECFHCSEILPVELFNKSSKNPSGYQSGCRACSSDKVLFIRMGITRDRYNEILAEQGGVCALCKQPETVIKRGEAVAMLAVDHDHACCSGRRACGKCVRGLLCHQCNIAVGIVEKRAISGSAIDVYIARHAAG